jgi:16S rRNA processing protein RimM
VTAPDELEIGRIDKPHGVRGEVVVSLVTNRVERLTPGTVLSSTRGPLTVLASRDHLGRFIVTFEGVPDRTAAEALRGTVLTAPPVDDADELWVHDLVGAVVIDQDGVERGRVEAVQANPASDLLVLEGGALVPVRFVTEVDPGVRIAVDVPAGLFDDEG